MVSTSLILLFFSYCLISFLFFGSLFWPLNHAFILADRLPLEYWALPVILGVVLGILTAWVLKSKGDVRVFAPSAGLVVAVMIATIATGLVVDSKRRSIVEEFAPDRLLSHSFMRSMHEVPRDFQFYLHAAALKDCVPYAWSYRKMGFYVLPNTVAHNVLPSDWIKECNLQYVGR